MAIRHSIKFSAEVKEAMSDVQKYVDSIGTSAAAVDRHAASLAGGKIISSTKNWVAAVSELKGVTSLTATEQERYNKILEQGIAKVEALGGKAPQVWRDHYEATKKAADGTTQVQGGLSGIMSKLGPMGPMIAGAFSLHAITSFVSGMVGAADQIQKMADRTGDTAGRVQELQHIASQTGTSFDGLINASQELQKRLGEGDEGVAKAIKQLGLNASELGSMGATEALYAINTAMTAVGSETDRARIQSELFGRAWKDLAPAMRADMQAMAEEAPKMADATVAALDKAGDRWDWMTGKVKVAGAELLNFSFEMVRAATAADLWEKAEIPIVKNAAAVRQVAASMLDASDRAAAFAPPADAALELLQKMNATAPKTATSLRQVAQAEEDLVTVTKLLVPQFTVLNGKMTQIVKPAQDVSKTFQFLGWQQDALSSSALSLGNTTIPNLTSSLVSSGEGVGFLSKLLDKGGGALTALGTVAHLTGNKVVGGIGSAIQAAVSGFASGGPWGAALAGAAALWSAFGDKIKGLFGGPNAAELAGREVVANFEENIQSMMNERQKLEAGNESWAQTVVVVRDAYLAMGKTEAEALAAVEALWASSKGGADAVAAAMRPIEAVLAAVQQQTDETGMSLDELRARALGAAAAMVSVGGGGGGTYEDGGVVGPREGLPGFASGVRNFGGGLALVGERGPEIVRLPRGSDVYPNGSGGGSGTMPGLDALTAEMRAFRVALAAEMRRAVRDAVLVAR